MAIAAWTPEFVKFLRDQSQKQGHPVPNIALSAQADHQDRVSTAGDISETYWGLIHQPVSIPKALRIPKVREALDKEWQKLDKGRVWFMDTVAEKKEVEAKCQKNGIECEFCNVMELRHNKNNEFEYLLPINDRTYKGRVVIRGDKITNEEGFRAVFSEQGASASHQAAAKFLDAIGRAPGNVCQDADATSAYTQVILSELEKIVGEKLLEIWVILSTRLHPKWWKDKFKDPVVKLRCNLWGHPLAGLYWEVWSSHIFKKCQFEPVPGWECLWYHPKAKLFLSSYVDDMKMAGVKENVEAMWEVLSKHLKLDPPAPAGTNTYIGVKQSTIQLTEEVKKTITEAQTNVRQMLKRYRNIDDQMFNIEDLQEAKKRNKATPEVSIKKIEEAIQAQAARKMTIKQQKLAEERRRKIEDLNLDGPIDFSNMSVYEHNMSGNASSRKLFGSNKAKYQIIDKGRNTKFGRSSNSTRRFSNKRRSVRRSK